MIMLLGTYCLAASLVIAGMRFRSEIARLWAIAGWAAIVVASAYATGAICWDTGWSPWEFPRIGFAIADIALTAYLIAIYCLIGRKRFDF